MTAQKKVDAVTTAPEITVAIPSHGGHERILGLLHSLLDQDVEPERFTVLVVDNASPVPLAEVVGAHAEALDARIVNEPSLGVAYARNRALREAATPLLIFLDDDVIAAPALVRTYLHAFEDPTLDAAGGPILPRLARRRPSWFGGAVLPLFAVQDLGSASDYGGGYPFSANCGLRLGSVRHTFDVRLGRKGRSLLSGEERRFFEQNAFERIAHLPEASVEHVIGEERLRLAWVARRALAQVRTRRAIAAID